MIEAMAAGVPVIATRGGAFQEIIEHGTTGLLVERGNSDALAKAIARLLSDGQLRKSMGLAGRQRAQTLYSWEHVVKQLLRQYAKIRERNPM